MRKAGDGVDLEDGLRLGAERDCSPNRGIGISRKKDRSWERQRSWTYSKGLVTPCFWSSPNRSVGYWSMITSLPGMCMRKRYGVKSSWS
jgi:hypothetical protein